MNLWNFKLSETVQIWLIPILLIVIISGGIRLKRQADLIQANTNWVKHLNSAQEEATAIAGQNRDELEDTTFYAKIGRAHV